MAKLTHQQKLDALAYRFYQGAAWEPKAGDFYTTSRADLELYQVVSVEGGIVRTRFTEGSDAISEWPEEEFLTGGFGPKRVFVPEWVICAVSPRTGTVMTDADWIKDCTAKLSNAIGGGSELFVRHGDEFRLDVDFVCKRISEMRERHHEAMHRAIRAERKLATLSAGGSE